MLAIGAMVLGFGFGAQAGPAMFEASFIMHAFGNDITSGTTFPYSWYSFSAVPLGHNCRYRYPYSPNGATYPHYCGSATFHRGSPATGTFAVDTGGSVVGGSIAVPQYAFGITATGIFPPYYPYLYSKTYATFANAAGTFFAGGGPAFGLGTKTHTGTSQTVGSWVIHEGDRGFGGTLGLLGRLGAKAKYVVTGKVGTYEGTGSWNMIRALGRPRSSTVYSYTPQGTNWFNPHRVTNTYVNNVNGNQSTVLVLGSGTPWTTGSVTVYAVVGVFPTILQRAGDDTVTPGGLRNLQLVTPALTHWIGPGFQGHTGHIGILEFQLVPEPGSLGLLILGLGALVVTVCRA